MSCNNSGNFIRSWKFNCNKPEQRQNYQDYLKSNDIVNFRINKTDNSRSENSQDVTLRSHDVQFVIHNNNFQEVVCHNERLGGNDDVSKLINLN